MPIERPKPMMTEGACTKITMAAREKVSKEILGSTQCGSSLNIQPTAMISEVMSIYFVTMRACV